LAESGIFSFVIPAKAGIYERKIGGTVKILLLFLRLCFIQRILTFAAAKLVPTFENGNL